MYHSVCVCVLMCKHCYVGTCTHTHVCVCMFTYDTNVIGVFTNCHQSETACWANFCSFSLVQHLFQHFFILMIFSSSSALFLFWKRNFQQLKLSLATTCFYLVHFQFLVPLLFTLKLADILVILFYYSQDTSATEKRNARVNISCSRSFIMNTFTSSENKLLHI